MQIRVVTLRYNEALQGFPEDALRTATFGREGANISEEVVAKPGRDGVPSPSVVAVGDGTPTLPECWGFAITSDNNNGFRLVSTMSEQTGSIFKKGSDT